MTKRLTAAERWLDAWDSQGTHRTGTEGDQAGADWLYAQARALGAAPVFEPFPMDRIDPVETFLEVGDQRFPGVPVFDSPPTGGLSGVLGQGIAVAELAPRAVYGPTWRALRQDQGPAGLVVLCQGEHPGLGLLNAEQFKAPYGAPAIHLDSGAAEAVRDAVACGAMGRLVSRYDRVRAFPRNVVVTLRGTQPSLLPRVVVMTPRSSWWQSVAERGGGLVCWLETLRALLGNPPACDVVLTANSGHELGHTGLDAFQETRPGWDRPNGAIWVHYGANIGAVGGGLSIMSADPDLRVRMRDSLIAAGQGADEMADPAVVPSGETRDIHRAGGRYVTLVGTNPWFHLPSDRFPGTVDVPRIARYAVGAAAMVVGLTR